MRKWTLALVLVLAGATVLWASVASIWSGARLEDTEAGRWHPMDAETYMESWAVHVRADNGAFFFCVFLVSNAGLGDFNPGIGLSYYDPDGTVHASQVRVPNGQMSGSTDNFDVHVGKARMWREAGGEIHLRVREGTIPADMVLTPTVAPWRNGTGRLVVGKPQDQWNWLMPAPRARVKGEVVIDGKKIPIAGSGFVDQSWSNKAYFSFSKHWYTLHVSLPDRSYNFHEIARNGKFNDTVRSLMTVSDGGTPRYTTTVERRILAWHEGSKYRHPSALDIEGTIDGDDVLIQARNGRYGEIIDPLSTSSYLEQKIVRLLVTDPMMYRVVFDVNITVKNGEKTETESGRAVSSMLYFDQ